MTKHSVILILHPFHMNYNIPENLKGLTEAEVEASPKNTDITGWKRLKRNMGRYAYWYSERTYAYFIDMCFSYLCNHR